MANPGVKNMNVESKVEGNTQSRRNPRFVIIGAGMAGVLAVIRLREAGYDNLAIYEKADRIGGTCARIPIRG
jgi:cation diffusion facilitator CzcD-associated flavoprotein CzcO